MKPLPAVPLLQPNWLTVVEVVEQVPKYKAMRGLLIVPPKPLPFAEIKMSVPVAVNENQTSEVAAPVQHVAFAKPLAVEPTLV